MEFSAAVSLVKDVVQIVAFSGGFFIAFFLFFQFAPKIEPRIIPQWIEGNSDVCILKIMVENKSKVRIKINPKNGDRDSIRLQILECPLDRNLPEWVSFSKTHWESKEKPLYNTENSHEFCFSEPILICESTLYLFPGETVSVERLVKIPENIGLHVAVQVKSTLSPFARLASWSQYNPQSWTTTAFIIPSDGKKDG